MSAFENLLIALLIGVPFGMAVVFILAERYITRRFEREADKHFESQWWDQYEDDK